MMEVSGGKMDYFLESSDVSVAVFDNLSLSGDDYGVSSQADSASDESELEIVVVGKRTQMHSDNFIVGSFIWNNVDYQGHFLHDLLEMIETGHAPGTPENPVDDLDEIIVVAEKENMKASEAFHWAADIMTTIGNGFAGAGATLGIATGVALVDPIPGDEVILGGLTATALTSAWLALSFGEWAEQKGDYYEQLEEQQEDNERGIEPRRAP